MRELRFVASLIRNDNDYQGGTSWLLGAKQAMHEWTSGEERKTKSRLPFLGVDGLPKTGQEWVNQHLLTATVIIPPIAGAALEIIVAAIRIQIQPHERILVPAISFPEPSVRASQVSVRV